MQNKSHDKQQGKPNNHVTKDRNFFYRSNSKDGHDNNWQVKSLEAKLVRSGQFVVVLQCLCAAVLANAQAAVVTAHGADEVGGRQNGAVFAASALHFLFLATFLFCFLNSFIHCLPSAGTITRSIFLVVWINFPCFEVTLTSVHESQGGEPDFPDSCC